MIDQSFFEICEVVPPWDLMAKLAGNDQGMDESYSVNAYNPKPRSMSVGMSFELDPYADIFGDESASAPPPWLVGFSRRFKKDTHAIDRKLMGRILEVLEEISDYKPPFQAHGDTFKPLKGELAGCWRYRIGDNRLVIQPKVEQAQINAIAFGARGSIYD